MISVFKAQPTGDQVISDLNLTATKTFPDLDSSTAGMSVHEVDAKFVVSALLASLPGGTVDAILRLLLEHRASLLRVWWPK